VLAPQDLKQNHDCEKEKKPAHFASNNWQGIRLVNKFPVSSDDVLKVLSSEG
jgi:hypothetical protein